ncbi:MAG: hypothetical protein AB9891_05775 [Anaerolineaceae bacterium]
MKKGLLSCMVVIFVIFGLLTAGVAVMFFAKICPPQGPWPMPPWCGEGSQSFSIPVPPAELPTIPDISEIREIPQIALTEAPELVIEKAVVISTRVDEIPYPDFYNNPTFSKAVVKGSLLRPGSGAGGLPGRIPGCLRVPAGDWRAPAGDGHEEHRH